MEKPNPVTPEYVDWFDVLARENPEKAKELGQSFTKEEKKEITDLYTKMLLDESTDCYKRISKDE